MRVHQLFKRLSKTVETNKGVSYKRGEIFVYCLSLAFQMLAIIRLGKRRFSQSLFIRLQQEAIVHVSGRIHRGVQSWFWLLTAYWDMRTPGHIKSSRKKWKAMQLKLPSGKRLKRSNPPLFCQRWRWRNVSAVIPHRAVISMAHARWQ